MRRPLDDPPALPRTAYSDAACPAPHTAPLTGFVRADIAIVGAGITGLSAALHAAEAGASVIVLEAHEIGWGASGRSFGQVVPYLRHDPALTLRHLGPRQGAQLIDAAVTAADLVFDLIARHRIACEASRAGVIIAAHTPGALRQLERRAAFWRGGTDRPEVLGPGEARAAIGGGRYWGCLVEPRAGVLNALSYVRGLAGAALAAGAAVHTRSAVLAVRPVAGVWLVETAMGRAQADHVLVCTDAYGGALLPELRHAMIPIRAHAWASRPLAEEVRRGILPRGGALTDTRRHISGIRIHPNGSVHMSVAGNLLGRERRPDPRAATARLRELFPQIGAVEWDSHWSGWVAMTPDQYPKLHALAPGLLAGYGYSGRGIALATLMGRELAHTALGRLPQAFPFTGPQALRMPRAASAAVAALASLYRIADQLDFWRYGRGPERGTAQARSPQPHHQGP